MDGFQNSSPQNLTTPTRDQVDDLDDDVVDPDWLDIEGELDERITWWTFPLHGLNHRPPQCQATPSTYL